MARIRSIKPSFWTDEKLTLLPREVRLTYVGLISHADDDGRLKGDPRLIKAAIYPLDDDVTADVIEKHLAHLAKAGRIVRYRADRAAYVAIPKFRDHQRISHPLKSELPAPPSDAPEGVPEDARSECGGCAEDARSECGGSVSGMEGNGGGVEVEVEVDTREMSASADVTPGPAWVADGVAWWCANAGRITPRVFRRVIAGSVEAHGWDKIFGALQCYVKTAKAKGRAMKLDWFVAEDARWIAEHASANELIGVWGEEEKTMAWIRDNPPKVAR